MYHIQNEQLIDRLGQNIYKLDFNSDNLIPLFTSKVPAGFPSPADDYLEDKIDLNKLITKNSPAAFIVQVKGSSMLDAGIMEGDYLVVDRSIKPSDGKIVVVAIDGQVTVKKLHVKNGKASLFAGNALYPAIEINENSTVEIFGVVVSVTHLF